MNKKVEKIEQENKVKFIKNLRKNKIILDKDNFKRTHEELSKKEYKVLYDKKFKKAEELIDEKVIIELRNVNKYYTNQLGYEHVLKDINLKILRGEIVVILGASGSGKSTLLNIISGLLENNSGDVIVDNNNLFYLNERQRTKIRADKISFVFQSYNLIPTLTVLENIKVGYNLRNKDDKATQNIDEIIEKLGLKEQANKYPHQLSGGQNQRVSIARALSKNPKILFADEPTGALDEERGREALQLLIDANSISKTTLVIVTHNPNFAKIADRVIKIENGKIKVDKINKKKIQVKDIKWS